VIEGEEENFLGTIDGGLDRIERIFKQMKSENRGLVSGADAAEMYQTYGFPPELFETMAAEHNFTFDWDGYQKEMEQHGIVSGGGQRGELFKTDPLESLKKAMHGSEFLGYESGTVENARVLGIIAGDKLCDMTDEVNHEQPIVVVLDKTPFYGEMGGQVGDTGTIQSDKFSFDVIDAQVDGGFTLHRGHLRSGKITLGDHATVSINTARRQAIRRAHSATHLLHLALRSTLGGHAEQQGSKVDDDILRFDFTNPKAVPRDVLAEIEMKVNRAILAGESIACKDMPLNEARDSGAMMLFGEKYPDVVRVVSMGDSKELCGGTHLENTAQVGLFKIISEESVAAGTRRITALTGLAALEYVNKNETALSATSLALKIPHEEVPARVEAMSKEIRSLKKQLAAGPATSGVSVDELIQEAIDIDGVKLIMRDLQGAGPDAMRKLIDQLRRKASPVAVMLGSKQGEGKVTMIAGVCRDLIDKGVDAVTWIRESAKPIQGGGGGRPDLAQAGGKKPDGLADAFEKAKESIKKMLS
jgi:alanyl-tRNA synthetase